MLRGKKYTRLLVLLKINTQVGCSKVDVNTFSLYLEHKLSYQNIPLIQLKQTRSATTRLVLAAEVKSIRDVVE